MRNDLLLLNCLPEKSAAPETDGFTGATECPLGIRIRVADYVTRTRSIGQ